MRCYAEKASLVSILNKEEQAYVNSMVCLFFIYLILKVKYVVIKSNILFVFFPPGGDGGCCCSLDRNEGGWHCERTVHVRTFTLYKDDVKANWSHARSWCKDQGGELAVIDDQYENGELNFVSSYLRDLELPTWIGLSDLLSENQYAWSDGVSPVRYTNWNDKEPNNDEGCVSMHASRVFHGTWNDTRCDVAKPYICKISSGNAIYIF
uniref:C-type lectin domain-containing protein n=1 Tax=Scophthalmus maximus TaxID=52904 RepID=A0A8D3CUK6_SCOMX